MVNGVASIPALGPEFDCDLVPSSGPNCRSVLRPFLTGPENQLVQAAIRSIVRRDPLTTFSPLVIYGPSGVGKTHLARGLVREWAIREGPQSARYTTATDFAREWLTAIQSERVAPFRAIYRSMPLLVVDDLEHLRNRQTVQQELIHTFDELHAANGMVLVTAHVPPGTNRSLLPALRSRLGAGLTLAVSPPARPNRSAILRQLADSRGIVLTEPIADTLAQLVHGTIPELLQALLLVDRYARAAETSIDAALIRRCMVQRYGYETVDTNQIVSVTAKFFSLRPSQLRGHSRRRSIVLARGIGMFLIREMSGKTLGQIGEYFGRRDHTTVLHNCRKIETLLDTDSETRLAIARIKRQLVRPTRNEAEPNATDSMAAEPNKPRRDGRDREPN